MNELEIVPEKEIEKEALLEKCLFGDTYDPQRGEACVKLAEMCRAELGEFPENDRKCIRQSIIDDTSFKNHEDISDTIEISGREFPRIYTEPSLFNGALFDYDKYIKDNKKEKLGFCNLALYGLESQFVEQIDKGFFQTIKNARDLQDAENLILNPLIHDFTDPEFLAESLNRDEFFNLLKSIRPAMVIDPEFSHQYRNLSPVLQKEVIDAIKEEMKHRKIIKSVKNTNEVKFEICNDITNPKVEKDKYNVCSVATLDGKMYFTINERTVIREAFKVDTWEDVKGINMNDIWKATQLEARLRILRIANVISYPVDEPEEEFIKRYKDYFVDYHNYDEESQQKIWDAYRTFSNEEILKMIIPQPAIYGTNELGKLKCIHNMLGLVEYPEAIKNRWLQLILDYEAGLITKEAYKKLESELAKLEKEFAEEFSRAKLREGGASKNFTKPTEYQPSRLRIYGLQRYFNTLFNSVLVENPLAVVGNSYVEKEIIGSFKPHELKQLNDNILLSESEIKRATKLSKYDPDDIWNTLYPLVAEQIQLRECNDLDNRARSSDTEDKYKQLLDLIGREWEDDKKGWEWECGAKVDIDRTEHPHVYKVASNYETGLEEHWDFKKNEPNIESHAKTIIEEYPDLDISDIRFILEINNAMNFTFSSDLEWLAHKDYFDIEEMAVDYISELPDYIDDISTVRTAISEIVRLLQTIGYDSDTISIFAITDTVTRFESDIFSPHGAMKDGHYTSKFREWIKGEYDRDFDEEIIFEYNEIMGK